MALLGVPLIVLMGFFPMLVGRTGGGIEVGLDVCVLVFLVCVTDPVEALVVWALGTVICQLLTDKQPATKAFNFGLGVLAGGLAVLVIELTTVRRPDDDPVSCSRVGLGALVYFVFDFVVTSISLSLEEGTPLREEFAPRGAVTAGAAFLAISSLGYLGAIVYRQPPLWATGLLVVPVATIVVASRVQSRGTEHARRLSVLLDTAVKVQSLVDRETMLDTAQAGGPRPAPRPTGRAAADAARASTRSGYGSRAPTTSCGSSDGPSTGRARRSATTSTVWPPWSRWPTMPSPG